jgi:hypothetical protein
MTGCNPNAVVPAAYGHVEPVEKVLFLTNGRSNPLKFATFLGFFDFFYSLVRNEQNE